MNGRLVCTGLAGWAAEARDVELGAQLHIGELRLSYGAHLLFICGRTIMQLLNHARLELDDGRVVELDGVPKLEIPCRLHDVPYRLTNLQYPALSTEKKELDPSVVRA